MICCIIAAYIYARITAALRRWCIYWGFMRRGRYDENLPTLLDNLRGRGPRPLLSTIMLTLCLVGMAAIWAGGGFEQPTAAAPDQTIPRLSQLIGI